MIRSAKAFAFLVILVIGGAGAALSAEVDFAGLTPSPGGCTTAGGDPGAVCANSQSFSAIGNRSRRRVSIVHLMSVAVAH